MVEQNKDLRRSWASRLEKMTCFQLSELTELIDVMGDLITSAQNTEHDLCHHEPASPLCSPVTQGGKDLSSLLTILHDFDDYLDHALKQRHCERTVETPFGTKLNV